MSTCLSHTLLGHEGPVWTGARSRPVWHTPCNTAILLEKGASLAVKKDSTKVFDCRTLLLPSHPLGSAISSRQPRHQVSCGRQLAGLNFMARLRPLSALEISAAAFGTTQQF